MLRLYEKHNLASESFLLNKETQVEFFSETVFKHQSVIASVCIFDTITASMRAVLH
jgi:hypothetical protein